MILVEVFQYPEYWVATPAQKHRMENKNLNFSVIAESPTLVSEKAIAHLLELGFFAPVKFRIAEDEWSKAAWEGKEQ